LRRGWTARAIKPARCSRYRARLARRPGLDLVNAVDHDDARCVEPLGNPAQGQLF